MRNTDADTVGEKLYAMPQSPILELRGILMLEF